MIEIICNIIINTSIDTMGSTDIDIIVDIVSAGIVDITNIIVSAGKGVALHARDAALARVRSKKLLLENIKRGK